MARWNQISLAVKKHEEITAAENIILTPRRRQHWLEYDPVAFAMLWLGIGFIALIVLTI